MTNPTSARTVAAAIRPGMAIFYIPADDPNQLISGFVLAADKMGDSVITMAVREPGYPSKVQYVTLDATHPVSIDLDALVKGFGNAAIGNPLGGWNS